METITDLAHKIARPEFSEEDERMIRYLKARLRMIVGRLARRYSEHWSADLKRHQRRALLAAADKAVYDKVQSLINFRVISINESAAARRA